LQFPTDRPHRHSGHCPGVAVFQQFAGHSDFREWHPNTGFSVQSEIPAASVGRQPKPVERDGLE
jgi:hypothetical protein